ncbi:hypothetical protein ABZP36_029657 [Zizania latifolia]
MDAMAAGLLIPLRAPRIIGGISLVAVLISFKHLPYVSLDFVVRPRVMSVIIEPLSLGTDLSRSTDVEAIGSLKSRFIDESTSDNEEDEPLVVDDEAIEDDYGPAPPSPTDESDEPSGNKDETVDSWMYDDF